VIGVAPHNIHVRFYDACCLARILDGTPRTTHAADYGKSSPVLARHP
jgi:hypothetical protein